MGSSLEDGGEYVVEAKKRFHPIVGRIWFSFLYLIAVGATFAVVLGGWSPATQMFSLYQTHSTPIISYLANATSFNETQFQHPDLPDYWSWGLSGTCELHTDRKRQTKCYHAFPPLFSLQDLVAKALSHSKYPNTAATISTWNSALAENPTDPAFSDLANSKSRRSRSISFFRGGAAAIVFSLLIGLGNFLASLALLSPTSLKNRHRKWRFIQYGIAIFDTLLFSGGLVCFYCGVYMSAADLGTGNLAGLVTSGLEVGSFVTLGVLLCRVISIPIIGLLFVCVLGIELLVLVLVGYCMCWFLGKMVEGHKFVGEY